MTKYILFVRDKTFLLHSTVTAAPAYNLIISNNWNNWIILRSGDYDSPQFQVITSSLLPIVLLLSLIWTIRSPQTSIHALIRSWSWCWQQDFKNFHSRSSYILELTWPGKTKYFGRLEITCCSFVNCHESIKSLLKKFYKLEYLGAPLLRSVSVCHILWLTF